MLMERQEMDISEALLPYQVGTRNGSDEFHVREYWFTSQNESISVADALELFRSSEEFELTIYGQMLPSYSYPDHAPLMFKSADRKSVV